VTGTGSGVDGVAPRGVAVLGSTGSIGRQALDVLGRLTGGFRIVALAARQNGELLADQARQFTPAIAALTGDESAAGIDLPSGVTFQRGGSDVLESISTRPDVDVVVVGTSGIVSLTPVLAALHAGKVVATANKEVLVAAGHLVMPIAHDLATRRGGGPRDPMASPLAWLRPIDSEHSAIWQCLVGERFDEVGGLVLTASGGPFLDSPDDLSTVTVEMALRHPTWRMGRKITIDSATLANKGLEVIEAHWLYDAPYDAIEVVIHPQSVVHSAVRFVDGSLKAQLGLPDMRLPIQFALTYPDRRPSPATAADLVAAGRLDFRAPDEDRFPALRIAREAGRIGSRASAAFIAADEIAVERFIAGSIEFTGIPRLLEDAVARYGTGDQAPAPDELIVLDTEIRRTYATATLAG
jgi:1-deoxy-D-xylulose-5-phosphate reductoisomerase